MSLGIVIKAPEGLVLGADSRVTLEATPQAGGPAILVNFDNATKLLTFSQPNTAVGAVTYGQAAIGLRTAHSYVPEFEASLPEARLPVQEFAQQLSDFFIRQWKAVMPADYKGPNMTFVVGGFNQEEPYGRVFVVEIPVKPKPVEQQANPGEFGITWGGQREWVDRLIQGYDHRLLDIVSKTLGLNSAQLNSIKKALLPMSMNIPLQAMPLQDCVNLAIFFLRTTISGQNVTVGVRGVGGPIDIATITRPEGLKPVQRKQIVGEGGG
jgi:hypothetical protein